MPAIENEARELDGQHLLGHAQYTPAPDGLAGRRFPYAQVVAAHNLSNKTVDSVAHEGLGFQEDMEASGA